MTAGKGPPSLVLNQKGHGMNAFARLLLTICAAVVAGICTASENASESGEPPSQAPAVAPPQSITQSLPVAPADLSTVRAATSDPSSSGKPDTGAQPAVIATSPGAKAQPVGNKPGRKILVDDTVNDAQLKQILAKGYQPESQARGNEVYYCRNDHELGSRFESKVCKTARRILQDEQQGKNATTTIQQTTGTRAGN
jgi:hypothetical protein